MNVSIEHLWQVADKDHKLIIGLMSGTSLDGLDIALCKISGHGTTTALTVQAFKTVPYPGGLKADLKKITSAANGLQDVCLMHSRLGDYHADLILAALRKWQIEPAEIDCIASHGQTVYHAPKAYHKRRKFPNSTLQIGDGDHIARKTGILTVSDFRQKHTAAGGEGAPLAALTDEMMYAATDRSRLLLNIGGIANFTYLPAEGEPLTTDTGPGNTLVDQAMEQLLGEPFDENGATARRGTVHPALLKEMLDEPFFNRLMPRTTGPELFNLDWVHKLQNGLNINSIADEDLIATLTWLTAQTIADAILEVSGEPLPDVYLSGGGMHNAQLKEWLEKLLEQPTHSFAEIGGYHPDAKEAACFAVLANEMLSGDAFLIKPKPNAGRRVNFGKISLPV